jgi:hypothetical protein
MGIFSDEKVIVVGTQVSRAIEDKMLPDSLKSSVLQMIFNNDPQLPEYLMDASTNNVGVRAERMYRWAKDNYIHGLPEMKVLSSADAGAVAAALYETIEGREVTVDYTYADSFNAFHYAFTVLQDTYGFSQQPNTLSVLSAQKGVPVYLVNMELVVSPESMEATHINSVMNWGISPDSGMTPVRPTMQYLAEHSTPSAGYTPVRVDTEATSDYFRVTYCWQTGSGKSKQYFEEYLDIPYVRNEADYGKMYVQGKYHYVTVIKPPLDFIGFEGEYSYTYKYFTYELGQGTYSQLDAIYTTDMNGLGSFFPWIYFRYEAESTAVNPTGEDYRDTKKLCKYLGLPFQDVADAIDENPDIDDVQQAFLMMGVPADTTDPLEIRYLYDFFKKVDSETGASGLYGLHDPVPKLLRDKKASSGILIQDKRLKMNLRYKTMRIVRKIGKLSAEYETDTTSFTQEEIHGGFLPGVTTSYIKPLVCHHYKKQISENVYEDVQVYGLEMAYYIFQNYNATSDKNNNNIRIIPLDYSITQHYSSLDNEILYSRSFHYVFNSMMVITLAWYEQDWFATFVTMVAFVWTVISLGSDGGTAMQLAGALQASNYQLAATIILKAIIVAVAVKIGFSFIAKILGPKFAILLAAAMAIYGSFLKLAGGNVPGAPWAEELLKTASGLANGAVDVINEALLGLKEEGEAFGLMVEKKMELLEEAYKLLDTQSNVSPFIIFGEAPEDYFNRTIHSGNVGTLSIDAISHYVDLNLELPKPRDTLTLFQPQAV